MLRLLNDRAFRRDITLHLANKEVREFWLREYEGYPARFRAEAIAPIQNKIGAFLSNPLLCRILIAKENTIDLRTVIDNGKILLVNLAKGKIGEDTASLLGAFLLARLRRTAPTPCGHKRDTATGFLRVAGRISDVQHTKPGRHAFRTAQVSIAPHLGPSTLEPT